jgi:hypothetical protein
MFRLLSAVAVAALLGGVSLADDKKDDKKATKLEGVWLKEGDQITLIFDFSKPDVLVVTAAAGDNALIITNKTTVEKDGTVKAKMTKNEVKGDFPFKPMDGYEFAFKIKIDGKTAKVSDYTANEGEDQGKAVVEGEYKMQEKKKDK